MTLQSGMPAGLPTHSTCPLVFILQELGREAGWALCMYPLTSAARRGERFTLLACHCLHQIEELCMPKWHQDVGLVPASVPRGASW